MSRSKIDLGAELLELDRDLFRPLNIRLFYFSIILDGLDVRGRPEWHVRMVFKLFFFHVLVSFRDLLSRILLGNRSRSTHEESSRYSIARREIVMTTDLAGDC
jgi:hypothetical protein